MSKQQEVLEVHLEEFGQHSWVKALVNTLVNSDGSALFRFAARPPGEDEHVRPDRHIEGATFPVMRWQDLNDTREPNGWIEIARERLDELDHRLVAEGWVRRPGTGRHWWTRTYVR